MWWATQLCVSGLIATKSDCSSCRMGLRTFDMIRGNVDRYLLYIDILGFSDLVRGDSPRIHDLYEVIASLNVHRHQAFHAIVFSDTILVYNTSGGGTVEDRRYLVMFLCEFAQDLQDRLVGREIFFRAVLVRGEFIHYELNSIPCFFGTSLIDAHRSEKKIPAIGLFAEKGIVHDSNIFETAAFDDKYNFVFITQTLNTIEDFYGGVFPISRMVLEESDLIYLLVPEVLHLKRIAHWAKEHNEEHVREKYANTLALYKARYPATLKSLEENEFRLEAISPSCRWSEILSRYPQNYAWAVKTRASY
jgi:hypothetical protein